MDGRQTADQISTVASTPEEGELQRVQEVWDAQAQSDPLWAVLSQPGQLGRRWDLDAFMATGTKHVAEQLQRCEEIGGTFPDRHLALDFGSGVGRLSQALGDHFDRVLGLDISPTMVAVARRLNGHGSRVLYRLNESNRLDGIDTGSVTLMYSHIPLQHVPSDLARSYLGEFLRVVKPGGIVIVQVPSHYADSYLPADRDDLPVAVEDQRVSIGFPVHPGVLATGQTVEVEVDVTNASGRTWMQSATHPLLIGNRWHRGESDVVAWNDGRARLPGRLGPGETVRLSLGICTPAEAGHYFLSVDVVQEGVCWFADRGPETGGAAMIELSVLDVPRAPAPDGGTNAGYFAGAVAWIEAGARHGRGNGSRALGARRRAGGGRDGDQYSGRRLGRDYR